MPECSCRAKSQSSVWACKCDQAVLSVISIGTSNKTMLLQSVSLRKARCTNHSLELVPYRIACKSSHAALKTSRLLKGMQSEAYCSNTGLPHPDFKNLRRLSIKNCFRTTASLWHRSVTVSPNTTEGLEKASARSRPSSAQEPMQGKEHARRVGSTGMKTVAEVVVDLPQLAVGK